MRRITLPAAVVLAALAAVVMLRDTSAQPAALVGTTLTSTSTGALSLCVGANNAGTPTTCTGTANAGAIKGSSTATITTSPILRPLILFGEDSSTSNIVASFYSNSSGDPAAIQFSDANTYNGAIGVDQNGAFTFWAGRSPGTAGTPRFVVSAAGAVRAATQPGFLAYNSADDTLQANTATIDFDTEVYDDAGNFAADTFTAPVAGRYLFNVATSTNTGSAGTADRSLILVTTARAYQFGLVTAVTNTATLNLTGSVIADMAAGNTAFVQLGLSSGTATVVGHASFLYTFFSGRLLP